MGKVTFLLAFIAVSSAWAAKDFNSGGIFCTQALKKAPAQVAIPPQVLEKAQAQEVIPPQALEQAPVQAVIPPQALEAAPVQTDVRAQTVAPPQIIVPPKNLETRRAEMPKVLRVVTFNTQNLHMAFEESRDHNQGNHHDHHSHRNNHNHYGSAAARFRDVTKTPAQILRLAQALRSAQGDIIALQEVHSVEELKYLNTHFFNSEYRIIFHRGNDLRGYEIAFLIRKSLPIRFQYESHKDMVWRDPQTRKTIPLFSRDAPTLILSVEGESTPFLILIGHHAKSKAGNRFDPEGERMRTAQHEGLAQIVQGYQAQYGLEVPTLVAGDFNTDIQSSAETLAILEVATDVFDLSPYKLEPEERCTHTTFAEDHYGQHCQLDGILLANGSQAKVLRAGVRRDYPRLPRTLAERMRQASDHLLVYLDIEY